MAGIDPRLIDFVAKEEGYRASAYRCSAGVWTVGFGFTTRPDGSAVQPGDVTTRPEAEARLAAVLTRLRQAVDKLVHAQVAPHVLDACTSLAFNIGLAGFTTSTALRRLNEGDLTAAAEAMKAWNKVTDKKTGKKKVDKGLVARRAREAALLREGWELAARPAALAAFAEPVKPLVQSRIMAGGAVAGIGSAVAIALQVKELVDSARPLLEQEPLVLLVTAAVSLAGAAWAVYARWDDQRQAVG